MPSNIRGSGKLNGLTTGSIAGCGVGTKGVTGVVTRTRGGGLNRESRPSSAVSLLDITHNMFIISPSEVLSLA
ncbi:hypothetical protein K469DRAFT_798846, partial [Zopfia rhizophila CBS 207.26]